MILSKVSANSFTQPSSSVQFLYRPSCSDSDFQRAKGEIGTVLVTMSVGNKMDDEPFLTN